MSKDFPVVAQAVRAWKDIGYYCVAEAHEHWLDVKVYGMYFWHDYGEPEWDGTGPLSPEEAPSDYAFDRAGAVSKPSPTKKTSEAQVYLSGFVKWDGCSTLRFDAQGDRLLHFCGKREATNVGVLLRRLYDLAAEIVPAFDESWRNDGVSQMDGQRMEWQFIGEDTWIFGLKVRGIVRQKFAEVYFNEGYEGREGGWRWRAFNSVPPQSGYEINRSAAIIAAEKALGLL